MRIRTLISLALLLPVAVSAQRLPRGARVGGRGPANPAPLPPTSAKIARDLQYRRYRISEETYPFISHFDAPGLGSGAPASWTSGGFGQRVELLMTRFVSLTFDGTYSYLGGPANITTMELGTRLHPQRSESRFYPYFDVRGGFAQSDNFLANSFDGIGVPNPAAGSGIRLSRGFGGVLGAGTEISLTNKFSIVTGISVIRAQMRAYGYGASQLQNPDYMMTARRFSLGLKFNPGRYMISDPDPTRP